MTHYVSHERLWSEPMPLLFQRQLGTVRNVIAPDPVLNVLARSCEENAEINTAFVGTKFTPHDFRRLFATEIVNGGLPIMLPRLAELEKDLWLRRKRAQEEQWLGEIEGIDLTLTFLRTEQADPERLTRRVPAGLGIPRPRH
ncbi:hypothetical protein [Streptomyces sp. NPDC001315]|uniref:hypothetical protein n=1 Tax=Streptomyces sp. NPDC001315 TaxID=3364562 RepID=UPI0036BC5A10